MGDVSQAEGSNRYRSHHIYAEKAYSASEKPRHRSNCLAVEGGNSTALALSSSSFCPRRDPKPTARAAVRFFVVLLLLMREGRPRNTAVVFRGARVANAVLERNTQKSGSGSKIGYPVEGTRRFS